MKHTPPTRAEQLETYLNSESGGPTICYTRYPPQVTQLLINRFALFSASDACTRLFNHLSMPVPVSALHPPIQSNTPGRTVPCHLGLLTAPSAIPFPDILDYSSVHVRHSLLSASCPVTTGNTCFYIAPQYQALHPSRFRFLHSHRHRRALAPLFDWLIEVIRS